MSRAYWKGPVVQKNFFNKYYNKNHFNIWSRNMTILDIFLEKTFFIHNGHEYKRLYITRERLGFKFGSFAWTRQNYKKKIKKYIQVKRYRRKK